MKPDKAFDARLAARKLLREGRSGALATLMPGSGDPYCSLVNVATAIDRAPILLLSNLALHTKNILTDARVSLMLDEHKEGDPLEGARIMLMGACAKSAPSVAVTRGRRCLRASLTSLFTGWRSAVRIWLPASDASWTSTRKTCSPMCRTRRR